MKDFFKMARDLAKELDTPEMRKIYLKQKGRDKNLDKMVDEMTKEVEDEIKHNRTPK
jgi:hypothetical protein